MEIDSLSDEILMQRVCARDVDAFRVIYNRYEARLFSFASRYCEDRILAEDLMQETFWRVWQDARTFDPSRGDFRRWVYRVALNAARTEFSHKRHVMELPLRDDELVALVFSDLSCEKEAVCRKHIDLCARCRVELESLEHAVTVLQGTPPASPPPFAWPKLQARIIKSGTTRDWTEPSWLPLILGHAGGILLIMIVILLLGGWLENASIWKSLPLWALARSFGPHGFVALVIFATGALLTLAMTPVFWWESQRVPQRLRDGIH